MITHECIRDKKELKMLKLSRIKLHAQNRKTEQIKQLKNVYHNQYTGKITEYIKPAISWLCICIVTGILFYNSLIFSSILFLLCPIYIKNSMKSAAQKENTEMGNAFKDALQAMSSALEAGYSVENSINEAIKDMRLLYPDNSRIIREFEFMENQIRNNISTENVFKEFAIRSEIEDIESFSEILITAKRTGGDLVRIIKSASSAIAEKSEVMQDIQVSLSGKKYEAVVMKSVPYLILLYFRIFSPEYLSILYDGIQGAALMTVVLCLYLAANHITQRIITIEV